MGKPSLKEIQQAMIELVANPETFEAFDRNQLPDRKLRHGLPATGVSMYSRDVWARRLLFCNGQLPLTRKILGRQWESLLKEYSKTQLGTSRNPVHDLAGFGKFLSVRAELLSEIPFVAELADYEYTRNVVWSNSDEIRRGIVGALDFDDGKTADRIIILNPTLVIKTYSHPIGRLAQLIHTTRKRCFSYAKELSYLAFYLEPESRNFKVHEIGSVAAKLLIEAQIGRKSMTLLTELALQEIEEQARDSARESISQLLKQLHAVGIIVDVGE